MRLLTHHAQCFHCITSGGNFCCAVSAIFSFGLNGAITGVVEILLSGLMPGRVAASTHHLWELPLQTALYVVGLVTFNLLCTAKRVFE
jgi:hypothetical protein